MKSMKEIGAIIGLALEEEEPIQSTTIERWGVYVDPETGKMVSKDIPKSESLNTITSCGRN